MSISKKNNNRLIHSSSPYLLQHAYNPVEWFEWGSEAFQIAVQQNKPILLSIGYSSCHWCHVMAHECFENIDIAQIMNEYFVCIKVDREERPDIDHIYMDALQAMGQQGGWPLNVFLTPDQKPFFGGTYFAPNRWSPLLIQISKAYKTQRLEIDKISHELTHHLCIADFELLKNKIQDSILNNTTIDEIEKVIESNFDFSFGGINKSPKFVMPSIWFFIARYHYLKVNPKATRMLTFTLEKVAAGGIYDQIGGGFARYSVDAEWFAPHFEKMLYDNAQLISLYSEAYRISNNLVYKNVIEETISWLTREMTSNAGGFYSAIDADSEGEEGKYYTWTSAELESFRRSDQETIQKYFNTTPEGNWEHGRNILVRESTIELPSEISSLKKHLLEIRNRKTKPNLDDKIITGWNSLMITALVDAYRTFSDIQFLKLAEKSIYFIERNLIQNNLVYRVFKMTTSNTIGFLDDYAFLIQAYISLHQVTLNQHYLDQAKKWCEITLVEFYDPNDNYFYFNSHQTNTLIARKKEIFDHVIPSSNAVMARNLLHLGVLIDYQPWQDFAKSMVYSVSHLFRTESIHLCHWAIVVTELIYGISTLKIVGKNSDQWRQQLQKLYLPFTLFVSPVTTFSLSSSSQSATPKDESYIQICHNYVCQTPVHSVEEILTQLRTIYSY